MARAASAIEWCSPRSPVRVSGLPDGKGVEVIGEDPPPGPDLLALVAFEPQRVDGVQLEFERDVVPGVFVTLPTPIGARGAPWCRDLSKG